MMRKPRARTILVGLVAAAAFLGLFVLVNGLLVPEPVAVERDEAGVPSRDAQSSEAAQLVGGKRARVTATPKVSRPRPRSTRFQRRVAAGDDIRAMLEVRQRGKWPEDYRARYQRIRRAVLSREAGGGLRTLARHGLDRATLTLQGHTAAVDPFGHNLMVRVWTDDKQVPAAFIADAASLMARLDRVGNVKTQRGFDVLATKDLGRDRIFEGLYPWAGGMFLHADRLCLVKTNSSPAYLSKVLKHELAHAWRFEHLRDWRWRFISEGLAQYMEWVQPQDYRLAFPLSRVRHNFAYLAKQLAIVEDRSGRPITFDMRRLLHASPRTFYGLRGWTYPISEAALCMVGAEVVERAVASGDESVLARALSAITWEDLRAFIGGKGKGGDPAQAQWVAEMAPEQEPLEQLTSRAQQTALLRQVGVDVDALWFTEWAHALPLSEQLTDPERLKSVIEGLTAAAKRQQLGFAGEATVAMNEPMRFRATLDGIGAPHVLDLSATPIRNDFIGRWLEGLRELQDPVRTFGVADRVSLLALPAAYAKTPVHLAGLLRWLSGLVHAPEGLILCLASSDERAVGALREAALTQGLVRRTATETRIQSALSIVLARELSRGSARPKSILVVDLSEGTSDGLLLSRALSAAWSDTTTIAYWDPSVVP